MRLPAALMLFSPWIDLLNVPQAPADLTTRAVWLRVCAEHTIAMPPTTLASPLHADLRGLPPTLIQAGADELLRRDAVDLHDALERAGVAVRCELVPQRWHAFQLHAGMLPSADAALARAAQFIAA
jgi:acetyl esterase/lipase